MKHIFLLITALSIIILISSCKKKEDFYEGVPCSINYADSSDNNTSAAEYQALLDKYVEKGIPGLVLLVYTPNEGLWVGSSGYSCIENKSSMNKCSVVYSASIGKTYCAVSIMQLVEEGKIHLEDKINLYLDKDICNKIPNGNKATIKDLLGHRAGIPNFETGEDFIADILNDPYSLTSQDLIEYEYGKKALFEPEKGYKYSSTGYELLAKIIDTVTGEHHSKYYSSHIFEPLGLINTYYKSEPEYPQPKQLVNCYMDRLGDGKIENVSKTNNYLTKILTGSDGIMASVYDYYLFIDALVHERLVTRETFNKMTEWHDTYSWTTAQYGLGLQKRETDYGDKIGHDGDAMGAGADMFYFPESGIIIVTATNLGTFLDTELVTLYNDDFQEEVLDIIFR